MPVKSFVTLLAITLIAIIIWWSQSFEQKQQVEDMLADQDYVDAFIKNFTMTVMDETGSPDYTLKASYYEHYNNSDDALVKRPEFRLLQPDNEWLITAQQGVINDSTDRVILHDDVVMLQQNTDDPVQLNTSRLTINITEKLARSDQPVQIRQGSLHIQSEGMVYNNKTGELELLANVSGRYEN